MSEIERYQKRQYFIAAEHPAIRLEATEKNNKKSFKLFRYVP